MSDNKNNNDSFIIKDDSINNINNDINKNIIDNKKNNFNFDINMDDSGSESTSYEGKEKDDEIELKEFFEHNSKIFNLMNDKNRVNVDFYKKNIINDKLDELKKIFIKHLQRKIDSIELRMRYINHKYTDYLFSYNLKNGIIIILSSALTLFQASAQVIDYEAIDNIKIRYLFLLLPLLVSTFISLLATLIKFQKYQEHMENLIVTEEKGIIAISKLKKIREKVYFSEDEKTINELKELYLNETYQFYNEVNVKISIELDEKDYTKYFQKMSKVDILLGNTFLNKTKNINEIIDRHTIMEKEYNDNEIDRKKEDKPNKQSSKDEINISNKKNNNVLCGSKQV